MHRWHALIHFKAQAEGNTTPPEWSQTDEYKPQQTLKKKLSFPPSQADKETVLSPREKKPAESFYRAQ